MSLLPMEASQRLELGSTAWDAYLEQHRRGGLDDSTLRAQLVEAEGDVFHKDKSNALIHNVSADGVVTAHKVVDVNGWEEVDRASPSPRTQFVSICSDRTIAPLRVTPTLMSAILEKRSVRSEFLQVLLSFGDEPHQSEASNSYFFYAEPGENEYIISYKLNFIEQNHRGGQDPWSFRQVGIYHHYRAEPTASDFFIVVHCTRETAFYRRLASILPAPSKNAKPASPNTSLLESLRKQPEKLLHGLAISCYAGNWRPYLRYLGKKFADTNDKAMVDNAEAIKQASFMSVQSLRNINDFALFANACCSNNVDILDRLASLPSASGSGSKSLVQVGGGMGEERNAARKWDDMAAQALVLRGNMASCEVLQSRIANAIELVGFTLTLANQIETGRLEKEIRDMTEKLQLLSQKSVDDSTVVRLITILSAVYLPGTFVGGIFGMNFFVFDTEARRIIIAYDFWIFILTWLGMSALTGMVFLYTWWRKERGKKVAAAASPPAGVEEGNAGNVEKLKMAGS